MPTVSEPIVMLEYRGVIYVGPMYYDDKGASIICIHENGDDKMIRLKDAKQFF